MDGLGTTIARTKRKLRIAVLQLLCISTNTFSYYRSEGISPHIEKEKKYRISLLLWDASTLLPIPFRDDCIKVE